MNFLLHLATTPRRRRGAGSPVFAPGVRPVSVEASASSVEVLLCEQEDGQLVLLDACRHDDATGTLLLLGRGWMASHHLSADARHQLEIRGVADVTGADACNALLALACDSTEVAHAG